MTIGNTNITNFEIKNEINYIANNNIVNKENISPKKNSIKDPLSFNYSNNTIQKVFTKSNTPSKKGDKLGSPEKLHVFKILNNENKLTIDIPENHPVMSKGGIYCIRSTEGHEYYGSVIPTAKGNCFRKRFSRYTLDFNSRKKDRPVIEAVKAKPTIFNVEIIEIFDKATPNEIKLIETAYMLRRKTLKKVYPDSNGLNAISADASKKTNEYINKKLKEVTASPEKPNTNSTSPKKASPSKIENTATKVTNLVNLQPFETLTINIDLTSSVAQSSPSARKKLFFHDQ